MSVPEPRERSAVVVDASVVVDLLARTEAAAGAMARLRGHVLHAPAHFAAEVLSALGRLQRAGALGEDDVAVALPQLARMPVTAHELSPLVEGAWRRRGRLRVLDALYIELAHQLDTVVVTTDRRLARADERAEAVGP